MTSPYTNIKAELTRNGVSQIALARKYGCSVNTINNKLNGRTAMTVDELVRLREDFIPHASLDYLVKRG